MKTATTMIAFALFLVTAATDALAAPAETIVVEVMETAPAGKPQTQSFKLRLRDGSAHLKVHAARTHQKVHAQLRTEKGKALLVLQFSRDKGGEEVEFNVGVPAVTGKRQMLASVPMPSGNLIEVAATLQ